VEEKHESALRGLRVLELADEKGVYCGKLLADMGADVIKIEPPGGDPTRALPPFWRDQPDPDGSLFFLYMNTNKRGVAFDITTTEGQTWFRKLAATADVVIETFPPGYLDGLDLGYEALSRENPGLVLTSITGFGQTGPHRDFKCSDLVASALGGALFVIGDSNDPPVGLAGAQAYVMASTCAAASTMMALHWRLASGVGQHVDISVEETTVAVAHIAGVGKWLDDGILPRRMGTALFASVPSGAYACKDGLVYLMVNRPLHWKALAEWVAEVTGSTAILDPLFEGPSSNRQPDRDLLDVYISDLTSRFTVEEVYREGQRRHLAVTPVNTAGAVAHDSHLAARGYFVEVEHQGGPLRYPGAPYRFSKTPWRIARAAPVVGEHNVAVLCGELGMSEEECRALEGNEGIALSSEPLTPALSPRDCGEREQNSGDSAPCQTGHNLVGASPVGPQALQGLRVLEFTAGMAGPWIGRFMAYCGAEVIKVESQKRPDVTRLYVPPWAPEMGPQTRLSPWFTDWNAGKRFVALDLTRPEAVDLAKRIVGVCDVVVENYAAGVIDKLGLGYSELSRVNPKLVMLSSSGYGASGPCRRYVTWGPNIEALSGLSKVSGFPHRECTLTQYAYPDAVSSLHGLFAVMCALAHRARTGEGQYIDLSQYETTVAAIGHVLMEVLANDREPPRLGNRSWHAVPHGCYRCSGEDRWCAVSVDGQAEWERLCRVLGHPEWVGDPRFVTTSARFSNADALDRLIEAWTSECDVYDVMNALQQAGIAAGVVQTVEDEFRRDRQLAARRFFEEIDHLVTGKVTATGIPIGLTRTPGRTSGTGAAIGQDNDYVFGKLLGMSGAEIQAHLDAGAIENVETSGRSVE
jgi:crotonobetainyl-CoA:carnitine CoA-transferase CaiB-like acyl-CoA transferase